MRNISALHQQFKSHKILQKTERLYAVEPTLWTPQHQIEYECLDALITESMLYAESRSAKKYRNTYAWSPTLVRSVSAERFWRLVIKQSQGHHVAADILHRTKVSAGITVDISQLTLPDAVQCLQSSHQTRKELQQNYLQIRRNYLVSLAQALVLKRAPYLEDDPKNEDRLTKKTAKEVKHLIRLEQKRKFYRMIGSQLSD